jgi:hypothetical protein
VTEAGWLSSNDPSAMLAWLCRPTGHPDQPMHLYKPSDRKLRLFACACVRALESPGPRTLAQVRAVEALADRGAAEAEYLAIDPLLRGDGGGWARHHAAKRAGAAKRAALLRDVVGNPWRPLALPPGPPLPCPECGGDSPNRFSCQACDVYGEVPGPCPWLTPAVLSLALGAYHERLSTGFLDDDRLGVLSDALEEAGCDDGGLLRHLRGREGPCPYRGALGHATACHWCDGTGWRPLPGPHARGCAALDAVLGLH